MPGLAVWTAGVWGAGFLLTAAVYVREQLSRPAYREKRPTWGGFLFRIGPRLLMLTVVWPFILLAYAVLRLRRRRPP